MDRVARAPSPQGVADSSRPSRLDGLTAELVARGLGESAAVSLAHEFVIRHPFAARLGMHRLVEDLEQRGLTQDAAPGAAGILLAIEMRDRGASFQQSVNELRALGLDRNESLASALSSARIHREMVALLPPLPEVADPALKALAWFGVAILLLSSWARLAG